MKTRSLLMTGLLSFSLLAPLSAQANDVSISAPGVSLSSGMGGVSIQAPGVSLQANPPTTAVQQAQPPVIEAQGRSFKNAKLAGQDFSNQNLSNADFSYAELSGANFSNSNLTGASFKYAHIEKANFSNALLTSANLSYAEMDGAYLINTDFTNAILKYAKARGVTVSSGTRFDNADMKYMEMRDMIRVNAAPVASAPAQVYVPAPVVAPPPVAPAPQPVPQSAARPEFYDASTITRALTKTTQNAGPRQLDLTVNFNFNADTLTKDGERQVQEIAQALKQLPPRENHIMIEGHTDSVGSASYNQDLSYRRAVRVIRTLTESYGIPAAQLSASGKGATQPLTTNETDLGRAMNRRVTIINLGS